MRPSYILYKPLQTVLLSERLHCRPAVSSAWLAAGYAMEKKSSIIAIGLTVHQTPVHIREQLSIAEVCAATAGCVSIRLQSICSLC